MKGEDVVTDDPLSVIVLVVNVVAPENLATVFAEPPEIVPAPDDPELPEEPAAPD